MRIKQFLTEDVNTHLYHIEEEIIRNGLVGAKSAVRYLMGLVDMLGGNADADVRATVKWDGAPAIVCGKDPLNGEFFVGTKSVFNARTPKINYTFDDIDRNHQGGLAKVLKYAHRYLSGLNIQGVVQGDLMYIPGMLKPERIDGEAFLTFTPNTITYAVQKGSKLYDQITKSKIGIVFHTKYDGDTMDTLSASFGVDVSELGQDSNVWYDDAYFKDFTGTATFKQSESLSLKTAIQKIDQLVDEVPMPLWMKLSTSKDFVQYMLQFINSQIKKGGVTQDPKQMMQQYINYYRDIQAQAKDKLKTDTAKLKRDQAVAVMGKLFAENERGVSAIIRIHNATMQIKNKIIKQINDVQSTKQFLKTDQGYQVTNPEGYVAIDNDGQAVKIVDRLTFSKANFSAQKLWAQEK